MKPLSAHARSLLDALWKPTTIGREALLLELADTEEVAAIPHVLQYALNQDTGQLRGGAMALHRLVSAASSEELVELDRALRDWGSWRGPYEDVQPGELSKLAALSPAALAVVSCHRSGFVRERALRMLAGRNPDVEWPFLLLRANDWVRPVRALATELIRARVDAVDSRLLIDHLPLVDALGRGQRADHSATLQRIHERMGVPETLDVLEARLDALPLAARREAYKLLVARRTGAQRADALLRAIADGDTGVHQWAASAAGEVLEGEPLRQVALRFTTSRIMAVRREGIVLLARHFPEVGQRCVADALFDPHPAIREFVRHRLLGQPFAARYREALAAGDARPGVLDGLGETGEASDAQLLVPWTAVPGPAQRRAALRALGRLDAAGQAAILRAAFDDLLASVSRTAAAQLLSGPGLFTADWLGQYLRPGAAPIQARRALPLSRAVDPWDAAPLLVALLGHADAEVKRLTEVELARWWRARTSGGSAPSGPQSSGLRTALQSVAGIEPEVVRVFEHLLRALR